MLKSLSTLAALAFASPVLACETQDQTLAKATQGTAQHGGLAEVLDKERTQVFLDYLNNKIGEPTAYKADTLVFGLFPDLNYIRIVFILDGCTIPPMLQVDPNSFMKAYQATIGSVS